MSNLPNILTIIRVVLVIPVVYFLSNEQWTIVLILLLIAGCSDLLDGWLARRFNWVSQFGLYADPVADKLMFVIVIVMLATKNLLPFWLVTLVITRDFAILTGAAAFRLAFGRYRIETLFLGKINTGVQVVVVLLLFVSLQPYGLQAANWAHLLVFPYGINLMGFLTVVSGVGYLLNFIRLWREEVSEQSGHDGNIG